MDARVQSAPNDWMSLCLHETVRHLTFELTKNELTSARHDIEHGEQVESSKILTPNIIARAEEVTSNTLFLVAQFAAAKSTLTGISFTLLMSRKAWTANSLSTMQAHTHKKKTHEPSQTLCKDHGLLEKRFG